MITDIIIADVERLIGWLDMDIRCLFGGHRRIRFVRSDGILPPVAGDKCMRCTYKDTWMIEDTGATDQDLWFIENQYGGYYEVEL